MREIQIIKILQREWYLLDLLMSTAKERRSTCPAVFDDINNHELSPLSTFTSPTNANHTLT
jgi:hypothetical protein